MSSYGRRSTGGLALLLGALAGAGCGGKGSAPASPGGPPAISVQGETSPSGIFDPSVLRTSATDVWMAYSGVDYHTDGSGDLVQDVSTHLAHSVDGGRSFTYVATLGPSSGPVTVTDTTGGKVCGSATCTGRWAYETPWLVDDAADPDPSRRFKLFAHKYFLYPPGPAPTVYVLGAIVMWTAPDPAGGWSAETSLLGWNLTPPELAPLVNVNALDPALAGCLAVAEGGASVRSGALDFVFACTYPNGSTNPMPQKIVLLRTADHAASFQYVSTLLDAPDAALLGASYYTAPSLVPSQIAAPVLIATPSYGGLYQGCVVIPFADESAGALLRVAGAPAIDLVLPPAAGHFGGACAWDEGLLATGILQNDLDPSISPPTFRILATGQLPP